MSGCHPGPRLLHCGQGQSQGQESVGQRGSCCGATSVQVSVSGQELPAAKRVTAASLTFAPASVALELPVIKELVLWVL